MELYCTYFDKNFLSRGLALLASLRAHARPFRLVVLCFDQETVDFLAPHAGDELCVVSIDALEAADPELAVVRSSRSRVEYFFTCTGAWARHALCRHPEASRITYLDADLFFFDSPQAILDEIGDASVAIIAHRFSSANHHCRDHGIFNVGWITWRRSPAGMACLEDYRLQTLDWCHDYIDGTRYADQRYLDDWPVRYQGVHVVRHPGANLGPWNIDNHDLAVRNGRVSVDGRPLVFFHFHALRPREDGRFNRGLDGWLVNAARRPDAAVIDAIYSPYEEIISRPPDPTTGEPLALRPHSGVRYAASNEGASEGPAWEHRPNGWDDKAIPGWNLPSVVQAHEDRLAIMRRRVGSTVSLGSDVAMHNAMMTFAYVASRAAAGRDALSVLDWGGGLGLHAVALDLLLPGTSADYHCREVPAIVDRGRALMPRLSFHDEDRDIFRRTYDLVMAQAALQHAEDWRGLLPKLAASCGRLLFIGRLPVVSSVGSYVAVQRLWRTDYRTEVLSWVLNRKELLDLAESCGLQLEREFYLPDRPHVVGAPEQPEFVSLLFRVNRSP